MRMTDIVSSLGLSTFPVIGLFLFLSVFVGVVWQVLDRSRRAEYDRAGSLPLDNDQTSHATGNQEASR